MTRVVLKLGGAVVAHEAGLDVLADEVRGLRRAGAGVVLVHGGGVQLDVALAALGEPAVKHKGLRITSPAAARIVQEELDRVGRALAEALEARGLPAVHVPSAEGRFPSRPKDLGDGVDLQRVGAVERFVSEGLSIGPEAPVAVVTPVGTDAKGPLNVNADEGAGAVAAALGAAWLLLATDVEHVRDDTGGAIARLDGLGARAFLATGAAQGGMIPKVSTALAAVEAGVGAVLITRVAPGVLTGAIKGEPTRGTLVTKEPRP